MHNDTFTRLKRSSTFKTCPPHPVQDTVSLTIDAIGSKLDSSALETAKDFKWGGA
jgi:hypothetical protein